MRYRIESEIDPFSRRMDGERYLYMLKVGMAGKMADHLLEQHADLMIETQDHLKCESKLVYEIEVLARGESKLLEERAVMAAERKAQELIKASRRRIVDDWGNEVEAP
jgi:hypothetical protein